MTSRLQSTPPPVPGYEITRLIGLGGMGEVYLARQFTLNRPVAIKYLTRTAGDPSSEYELRFRREAELMAKVSHPNVVTIFDFGTVAGRPYLVMEYIEAGDLRSRMVADSPMAISEIRSIIRPVIRATEHLHRQGIIHRDLKPENILIHHEGTPKVTDFGIAVLDFAFGSLTRTGVSLGTPGYVAPEQQYGLKVDERADQFSLAALCYEMATGRKPLGAFLSPDKLNPKLGREAAAVILKALSEEPADRFETIGEFGEALDHGLSAGPKPFSRRRTGLIAAGVMASILMVINILFVLGRLTGEAPNKIAGPPANAVPVPVPVAPLDKSAPDDSRIVARAANLTLVKIPSGEFWMGSSSSDTTAQPDEFPRHLVRISRPFYLGEKEVTVGQFRAFVGETHYRTTAEKNGAGGGVFNPQAGVMQQKPEWNWQHPGPGIIQQDDEPVVQVSWDDAIAFCDWLSHVERRPFRLPTEAEWEYACRAETTTRWSSGDNADSLGPYAWTLLNANFCLHPVGTKRPNKFGLYDMHGNVWEWCADWLGPYSEAAISDPKGYPKGERRIIRGGSIDWDKVEYTRSAVRLHFAPDKSYSNYGFRICSPAAP